jgi:hypothetical protein
VQHSGQRHIGQAPSQQQGLPNTPVRQLAFVVRLGVAL